MPPAGGLGAAPLKFFRKEILVTLMGGGRDTIKARGVQSMGFKASMCEDGGKPARTFFYLNPPTGLKRKVKSE